MNEETSTNEGVPKKKKPHTKQRSYIREKEVDKDYSKGNSSPYRDWVETQPLNLEHNPHGQAEYAEANPDVLSEESGLYYQKECDDERLDLIERVTATLTDKQKEILHLCGNEGRTMENCAAILGISKGTVQKTLDRIREKVRVIQEES